MPKSKSKRRKVMNKERQERAFATTNASRANRLIDLPIAPDGELFLSDHGGVPQVIGVDDLPEQMRETFRRGIADMEAAGEGPVTIRRYPDGTFSLAGAGQGMFG